jgi:hypothetical protein
MNHRFIRCLFYISSLIFLISRIALTLSNMRVSVHLVIFVILTLDNVPYPLVNALTLFSSTLGSSDVPNYLFSSF